MSSKEWPWLLAALDQHMAKVQDALKNSALPETDIVMMTLTEPPLKLGAEAVARWERGCDNCGKDCTDDVFYTGYSTRKLNGQTFHIQFGACADCARQGEAWA